LIGAPLRQRWDAAMRALEVLRKDPSDPDAGRTFTLSLDGEMYQRVARALARSPEGRSLLADRPMVDASSVDLHQLAELPEHTLGGAYTRHLHTKGFKPFVKILVPDDDVEYVAQWIFLTHDLWHVATGYDTDKDGEVDLQMFYLGQTNAPSAVLVFFMALVKRRRFIESTRRWGAAYLRGRAAGDLVSFRWDRHWSTPLAEVRRRLAVAPPS
jgi:ubiquinone biosynthesis protein COQ4